MPLSNGVMMQYFHFYTPADGKLWKQLAENSKSLAELEIPTISIILTVLAGQEWGKKITNAEWLF
ncbi:hypothetical protein EV194_101706 [Natronoflexus pectinivorans]|uniref:Uncharacterized protein n=1 Tax=Natronoflexus pectinivorans TaxID=682526 RepID=A0A4R2GP67_9BACT|nr:hypothetical protein EV194_101706 [Natronoflexus pectinivorans]